MKWLIACESSGIVRDAFIAAGHQAISCDIKPSERPGPHLQCDVRQVLHYPWDGMVAHPTCKILTNAGVRWLYLGGRKANGPDPERWRDLEAAAQFYNLFCNATHIPRRAVENPIMHEYAARLVGHPRHPVRAAVVVRLPVPEGHRPEAVRPARSAAGIHEAMVRRPRHSDKAGGVAGTTWSRSRGAAQSHRPAGSPRHGPILGLVGEPKSC